MANTEERQIADDIYKNIGGSSNAEKVYNCMTRVRIDIKNRDEIDVEKLKTVDGVLGVVEDDGTLQIVVGPGTAAKVANEMADMGDVVREEEVDENLDEHLTSSNREQAEKIASENKSQQKGGNNGDSSWFKQFLNSIANIFVPLIPAFVGAGLIGGFASILQNLMTAGTIDPNTWGDIQTVLGIIQNGLFTYLNIYIGINAAKVFGATEGLGGVIGGVVYLAGVEEPLTNIFTGGELSAGQGGVIGVVFAVWILALVERNLKKVVPNSVDIIVTPTFSLLVVGLLTIFLIMPIAGAISSSLVGAITWVLDIGGAFAGFVLGSTFLPLVMFGLHQILTPIHLEMIDALGQTNLLPILAMAGAGQVGAAIAIWVKARKNKELTNIIKGSLPVGILGIGEPLIYAVTLPLGRPFITACIGGGVGGAIIGFVGNVGATTVGPSGVALIPLIAGDLWWAYVLGLLGAYAGGFVVTYFFGVPDDAMEVSTVEGEASDMTENI